MKHSSFLSTWSCQNLASPAGSSMDLMVYCNWITTSYNNSCFNLFFVSKFFMPLSLCYSITLSCNVTNSITYIYLISLLALKQCVTRPPINVMVTRQLETTNRDIVLYDINNYNSVILGMGKSNKRNISWILTGKKIEDPENLFLPINGLNLEINTWSDILTRTFTWSDMSLPVLWDKKWSWNVSQILIKFLTMERDCEMECFLQ